jgi:16S rRNA (guanine1516-N2)-methyltransferase
MIMKAPAIAVCCSSDAEELIPSSRQLASELRLPFQDGCENRDRLFDFLLCLGPEGLTLHYLGQAESAPVRVNFDNPKLVYRLRDRLRSQGIARAAGIKPGLRPAVLDATAGLGKDAFLFASLGCQVRMLERNPIVHALLHDGLQRAAISANAHTSESASRMQLSLASLAEIVATQESFDVVYLDPMFPARRKSARVKNDLFVLQRLLSCYPVSEEDPELLALGLTVARRRVVVKRPARAPDMAQRKPTFRLAGRSSRYDVYVTGP